MKDDTLLFLGCLDATVRVYSLRRDPKKPNGGVEIEVRDEVTCLKAIDMNILLCGQVQGYIHLIDTDSKSKVGDYQLLYGMEETKADVYDIVPVQKQGHYAVGTKRGLFIISITRVNGSQWDFQIIHRDFNDMKVTPFNQIRALAYTMDSSLLIGFQKDQNLYLYNYESKDKNKMKNFIVDNAPYKIISLSELELQPIGSQQMIHQRGIPSDLFIMQGDTAVAIIDVANFEHLKIQEVPYGKSGLHVSLAAPNKLVI